MISTPLTRRRFALSTAGLGAALSGFAADVLANNGSRWVRIAGKAREVAIGANGQVWVLGEKEVNGGFAIYRRDGDKWTLVPGGATKIAVDPSGLPWVVNDQDHIFQWINQGGWRKRGEGISEVAISAGGLVLSLTSPGGQDFNGTLMEWSRDRWNRLDGRGVVLAVDPKGLPWMVNAKSHIYQQQDGLAWKRMPGEATDMAIGANGAVWVIGTDSEPGNNGGIYRWQGSGWTKVAGGAVQVAVGPDGLPWVVNADSAIFQRV